jgi:hypothetical protein
MSLGEGLVKPGAVLERMLVQGTLTDEITSGLAAFAAQQVDFKGDLGAIFQRQGAWLLR